jgi:hypothetical protein
LRLESIAKHSKEHWKQVAVFLESPLKGFFNHDGCVDEKSLKGVLPS